MRTLLMLRHAKSDWRADYGGDDRQRPLAKRGRRAAKSVGRFLAAAEELPERVLVSPALRAQQTVELARHAGHWASEVDTCEELYGDVEDVVRVVRQRGGDADRLLIVGHEPTWSATASVLTDGARLRLPTASLLRLDLEIDAWPDLEGGAVVQWLVTPRLLSRAR